MILSVKAFGRESAIMAMAAAKIAIFLTVISVMPITVSTITIWIAPTSAASHGRKSKSRKAPIAMSKIAVPVIAWAIGIGNSPAAQG